MKWKSAQGKLVSQLVPGVSKISWNHHFSCILIRLIWSPVQQSTINCSGIKIQNTRFDESDGPVAKIVKGWKKMFLCWCQQKFAVHGGRQRSRGRCTCQWSHSETQEKKKKQVPLFGKACYTPTEKSLSHTNTRTVRQGFFLFYQNLYFHINISFTVPLCHIFFFQFILQWHKTC